MSVTDVLFDGSTNPGTVIVEVDGLRFRARFDSDAEAKEVAHALLKLKVAHEAAKHELHRVRSAVARLYAEVTP